MDGEAFMDGNILHIHESRKIRAALDKNTAGSVSFTYPKVIRLRERSRVSGPYRTFSILRGISMKKSRLPAVGVLTAMALVSLAACGSDSSSSDGTSVSSTDTGAEEELDEITMWTFKQSHVEALEAVGEKCSATTGVTVAVEAYTPDDAYATKVRSANQTGDLPDIVSAHSGGEEWQFAQAGILTDITEGFDETSQSNIIPSVLKSATLSQETIDGSAADPANSLEDLVAGNWYAAPYLAGTPGVVFARKSILEAAGVDTETPPATWEEWIAAIQQTHEADDSTGGIVTGLKVPETGYFWLYRPMAYGYLGSDAFYSRQGENPDPAWDATASVESLELYDQLTPYWRPGVLNLAIDEADVAFAQGKAAWDVGGTFTLPFLSQQGVDPDDVMVFPIPMSEAGELTDVSFAASPLISAGVTSTSEHPEESLAFIKCLTSPDGAALFAQVAQDVPATELGELAIDDPLVQQLLGVVGSGDDAFEINDFSADPGAGTTGIPSATAGELVKLVADQTSPEDLGATLAALYADAWAAS